MVKTIPKISIILVGYKSTQYLQSCLKSIAHQTNFDQNHIEVIYIDNGSFDGSITEIQRNHKWVSTLRNMKNVGLPAAVNQGITYSSGDYIVVMDPDVILEKDYLENAIKKMQHDAKIGALMGKIYRYDFNRSIKTAILDTVGVFAMVDREIISGRGIQDMGQFEDPQEIFSIRNVCGVYRKRALNDVKVGDEYFEEDCFLYWDDIDLCWRLHLFGWKVFYQPNLIAYHAMDTKKVKSQAAYKKSERRYFMKNERLVMLKNEFLFNMIIDFWIILKKRLWTKSFIREKWMDGWWLYLKEIPAALRKRFYIMKHKRVNRAQIRKWFIRGNSAQSKYYKSKGLEIYAKYPPTI